MRDQRGSPPSNRILTPLSAIGPHRALQRSPQQLPLLRLPGRGGKLLGLGSHRALLLARKCSRELATDFES